MHYLADDYCYVNILNISNGRKNIFKITLSNVYLNIYT